MSGDRLLFGVLCGASMSLVVACSIAGGWRMGVIVAALLGGKAWGAWKGLPK